MRLLLQAITEASHHEAIKELLQKPTPKTFLGGVAFARVSGVEAIAPALGALGARARLFVGIRNDITSLQALERLLSLGVRTFVADTGTRARIFHPKVFVSEYEGYARLLLGSANLTNGGLFDNIEAGVLVRLDFSRPEDKKISADAVAALSSLPTRFPDHVFEVTSPSAIAALVSEGRLADERVAPPVPRRTASGGRRDSLRPIPLPIHRRPPMIRSPRARATKTTAPTSTKRLRRSELLRLWESRELTERDLNIPRGANTNRTGSMLWKKGALEGIDQRTYFRREVFGALNWRPDPRRAHIERAEADFQLVVKGVNYGTFKLTVSHDKRTTSKTYAQKNSVTYLHWGDARQFVAKPDLLGRRLVLYGRDVPSPQYLIEID